MIILSHRGYWKTQEEKNTETAFRRSFYLGFGTETDVRDYDGRLVISHDPPMGNEISFERFLQIYIEYNKSLCLAINIKADGLQELLQAQLNRYNITNYFVFDMSVPDGLQYLRAGFKVFTRQSEYESAPSFCEEAEGIWIDCFKEDWIDESVITGHIKAGKQVCVVSPDLHQREYEKVWEKYRKMSCVNDKNLMICTDFPEHARKMFS